MSDSPQIPPEETTRPIFAETRASTLIPQTPTSGSQTLVPTPETLDSTEPQSGETIVAPEPNDSETATLPAPSAPINEPNLQPVTIEATTPQVSFDTPAAPVANAAEPAPLPNAVDAALALTFAPAPDAPFQSSVTVGIRSHVEGARIFYTLDGTAPDETSTPYSPEKILLTQSATLSARAYVADKSGPICSADYVVSKPLWQENEPADRSDETPHKTSENQSAPDSWRLAAASVRGKLHAHRALWREDSFSLGNANQWSIVIVSDGAGSAPLSRVGSRLACEKSLENLRASLGAIETLSDDINADLPRIKAALISAAQSALQAIRDEAATRNQPINVFAATLLILVRRAVGEAQLCAALQVGDGAIALDCASGLKLLGAADHGQHSSETRFLTTNGMEEDFANRVKFSLPTDLRATLVVSDGVSDDYFPEDKRLNEVFDAVMPLAQNADDAGAALLNWLGYEKKGSSDDRTLVLSWPAEPDAVAALEAELTQSSTDEMAGLAPSSKQGSDSTPSLEEGASPAPETSVSSASEQAIPTLEQAIPASEQAIPSSEQAIPISEQELSTSELGSSATATASPAVAPDAATSSASNSTEMRDGT